MKESEFIFFFAEITGKPLPTAFLTCSRLATSEL